MTDDIEALKARVKELGAEADRRPGFAMASACRRMGRALAAISAVLATIKTETGQ